MLVIMTLKTSAGLFKGKVPYKDSADTCKRLDRVMKIEYTVHDENNLVYQILEYT